MPTLVIEDHMLDWHKCQICYPLEIKLLLLLLSKFLICFPMNHRDFWVKINGENNSEIMIFIVIVCKKTEFLWILD